MVDGLRNHESSVVSTMESLYPQTLQPSFNDSFHYSNQYDPSL